LTGHTSETHKRIRKNQSLNKDDYHHPLEKINQLKKFNFNNLKILELFAGKGNLSKYYNSISQEVLSLSKETTGDSFDYIFKLRFEKKKFDLIDIDGYGYPDKFFPVVFDCLKDKSYLVFTFPVVGVNCLNGITEQHYINFWRSNRPTIGDIVGCITDFSLRNWQLAKLIDVVKIKRIWRFIFLIEKQKATELCHVRNK
tara:strand:- start:46 stop:642 length:597 start_codon:yes stop_codon:yes gene_type:complete